MPIKILVFESDAGFAEQLRVGFAALGCETTVVDDANLGLQAASREKPDLILLSIELPRMNGFSVCNKLKRDVALKDVPLIIMSSESTEETFEQHRRLRTRAEDYVHKPIGFDNLLSRIQPFVAIGAPAAAEAEESENLDDAIVMDDDIEIDDAELVDDAPEVETSIRESMVDQDVNDFAD
jgi:DNA-binding response OmpR family regulator